MAPQQPLVDEAQHEALLAGASQAEPGRPSSGGPRPGLCLLAGACVLAGAFYRLAAAPAQRGPSAVMGPVADELIEETVLGGAPVVGGGPSPGPWQCHDYDEARGEGEDWCHTVGYFEGYEYQFFGQASVCNWCWCCKRVAQAPPERSTAPATKAKETSTTPATKAKEAAIAPAANADETATAKDTAAALATKVKETTAAPAAKADQASMEPAAKADEPATEVTAKEEAATTKAPKHHAPAKRADTTLQNCSGPGEDCRTSKCCSLQGMQCYAKNEYWAACSGTCNAEEGWQCTELGTRSLQKIPGTWAGEDCSRTKLCANDGLQCLKKDALTAYCTLQAPPDWDGTLLGGFAWEYAVAPVPEGEAGAATGASLFCFMASLPGSMEDQLVGRARELKASIFSDGCNASAVYQSMPADFVHQGTWNSFQNTDSFVSVWAQVLNGGLYKDYEWTVKVDPDCVFLPYRLQPKLQALRAPADKPVYIKNCDVSFGFLGAIEIINRVALVKYFDSYLDCHRTMGSHSGEDGFVKGCLDSVGAGYMTDASILRTPQDSSCTDASRVAFHPHKDPGDWAGCFFAASR